MEASAAEEKEAFSVQDSDSELEIELESQDVSAGQGAVSTKVPLPTKPASIRHKASGPPLPSGHGRHRYCFQRPSVRLGTESTRHAFRLESR